MEAFLGGGAVRSSPRSEDEVLAKLSKVPKDKREDLKPADKAKLQALAEAGIEPKFDFSPTLSKDGDLSELDSVHTIGMRLAILRRDCAKWSIDDPFQVPSKMDFDPTMDCYVPAVDAALVNLFDSYSTIDLDLLKRFSEFQVRYGPEWLVENNLWSAEKVLASCSDKLKDRVVEAMEDLAEYHKTGPVLLKIALTAITSDSAAYVRKIKGLIEKAKLTDFVSEDVNTAVSWFRGAHKLLLSHNQVPDDFILLVLRAFKAASTPDFANFFDVVHTNQETGVKVYKLTEVFDLARTKALDLQKESKWTPSASAGLSEDSFFYQQAVVCFNCGETGHRVPECPKPRDPVAIEKRKTEYMANRKPRGSNRGRRGGRNGDRDASRIPPRAGEPHTRTRDGSEEHWCGIEGQWGNHLTANCPKRAGASSDQANLSSTGSGNSSTGTGDGSTAGSTPAASTNGATGVHAQAGLARRSFAGLARHF